MDDLSFTEDDIIQELAELGYYNIPKDKLALFKQDLKCLINTEHIQNSVSSSPSVISRNVENYSRNLKCVEKKPPREDDDFLAQFKPIYTNVPSRNDSYENRIHQYRTSVPDSYLGDSRCLQPSSDKENIHSFPNGNSTPIVISAPSFARPKENESSDSSILNSSTSSNSRYIKRRALRKVNGHVRIDDEFVESEFGDLSTLEERLASLNVQNNDDNSSHGQDSEKLLQYYMANRKLLNIRPHSAGSSRSDEDAYSDTSENVHKAFIRPMSCDPHHRNFKRHDPVSSYHKYKDSWNSNKVPGEKNRNGLRWAVREQMLQHDEIIVKRPVKSHAANSYIVPSDKKRSNLRWQIRHDLAHGMKPYSVFDE